MSVESPNEIIGQITEAQQHLNNFWPKCKEEIMNMSANDVRQQELPLARIKRIMKLDDDVKMISAEAPALFSKAAEIFITELTLRAWVHTEDNKRRTLQKNDIAMAITKYDQFDFLIDIVPRDEIKPAKTREEGRVGVSTDQHYFQIAQHYQTVLQQSSASNNAQTNSASTAPQTIQLVQAGGQVQTVQTTTNTQVASQTQPQAQQQPTQIIQLQTQAQQPAQQQQQQQQQSTTQGGIQIIQQIMGPDGQIQQIPIQLTPQQLQMIRLQMSGATQQPIIIQTAPIQSVNQSPQPTGTSQPQIIQLQQVG